MTCGNTYLLPCVGGGGLSPTKRAPCDWPSLNTPALLVDHPLLLAPLPPLSSVIRSLTLSLPSSALLSVCPTCLCFYPIPLLHWLLSHTWSFCLHLLLDSSTLPARVFCTACSSLLSFLPCPGGIAHNTVIRAFKPHCTSNPPHSPNDDMWQHDRTRGTARASDRTSENIGYVFVQKQVSVRGGLRFG